MRSNGYLFRTFIDRVVTDDANDPVREEIRKLGCDNGLTVAFNKVGGDEVVACVMPPENQVNIDLIQGGDDNWRVFNVF